MSVHNVCANKLIKSNNQILHLHLKKSVKLNVLHLSTVLDAAKTRCRP